MSRAEPSRTCSAAISYGDLGWLVIPIYGTRNGRCACGKRDCDSPGKHPHGKLAPHGLKDATRDGGTICRWFSNGQALNVAVRTGGESGVIVIDIDTRHGGDESLAGLGELPRTATVATGGGGKHLYFKMPGCDIRNSAGVLGPGIDVRANGGYAVAPPSVHVSGKGYEWFIDPRAGIAELPPRILALLAPKPKQATAPAVTGTIPAGRRNDTLTSLAGTMRRRGMTEAAILAALGEENRRCDPPLSESELAGIVASIGKKPPAAPKARDIRLRIVTLDTVTERQTDWLWENWIPYGALTIIGGNPGAGKSSLGLDVATRLSKGWPMPTGAAGGPPSDTTIVGEEDSAGRIVRPRLRKMGADLTRIKILEGITIGDDEQPFTLDAGLEALDVLMRLHPGTKLVILDPITDYLGFAVNANSNGDVRRVLKPLNPWADRHNVAVVGITHLNKRKDDDAAFRLLGSMGFMAVGRAVLGISIHPEDVDKPAWEKRRLVTPMKLSYAPEGDAVVFRIDRAEQTLLWDTESLPMGANEALSGGVNGKPTGTTKAEAWLRSQLDNAQGPIEATTLKKRAEEYGVCSDRALYRAADKIGVSKATTGFGTERVVWWGRSGMDVAAWLNKGA